MSNLGHLPLCSTYTNIMSHLHEVPSNNTFEPPYYGKFASSIMTFPKGNPDPSTPFYHYVLTPSSRTIRFH